MTDKPVRTVSEIMEDLHEASCPYKQVLTRLTKTIVDIRAIACGEEQVADDDTEALGVIFELASTALEGGGECQ